VVKQNYYAECCKLAITMNGILVSDAMLNIIKTRGEYLIFNMLNVTIMSIILLSVVILSVCVSIDKALCLMSL